MSRGPARRRDRGSRRDAVANRRIRLLVVVFAIVFTAALARAGWLQAVQAPTLEGLAQSQHRETLALPAQRGTIYDANGVELAIGQRATTIYANPRQIADPRAAAIAAGNALGIEPGTLLARLSDRSKGFVYVARKVDPTRAALLAEMEIPGFGFYPEERRIYPQGSTAAEVLGFAGLDNNGLAGLELQLDGSLKGIDGQKTVVRDPAGRTLEVLDERAPEQGRDVRLTIDHVLQGELERVLDATRQRWSAQAATGIVMDPKTGGILAMAVAPGYDANSFPSTPKDFQRNRAVTDTYEPGSTFKLVTIAGELDDGDVKPWTRFRLGSSIQVADRVINEHDPLPKSTLNVGEILTYSSNVGTVTLALRMGKERLGRWISRFGFGHPTGIDFPGETAGIVLPARDWSGSTIGNVPIGHGIAVTPVQMAAAYAAVANKGVWTQPHLVERVEGRGKHRPERRRIVSMKTARELRRMLTLVVRQGTGTEAQVAGYTIAGKTGTAAKPEPWGGYSDSRYVASFVGFVPAASPRLVVLVTVDEPRGAIWGGVVAAPAFAEIARFGLQYLEIQPDRPAELAAASDGGL